MAAKVPEQKIADCRELYLRYGGADHVRIAAGMRERGWRGFTKRNLYARTRGGRVTPGWPERFGWDLELGTAEGQKRSEKRRRARSARRRAAYTNRRTFARESTQTSNAALDTSRPKFNRQKAKRLRKRRAVRNSPDSLDSPDSTDSPDSFHAWLKTLPGIWDWDLRHQLYLYEHLQRVTAGECKRLMIFMPPRHGKSELVTVRYAAWRLKQRPSTRVIISSYNQRLADNFSRKVRRVLIDSVSDPPEVSGGSYSASIDPPDVSGGLAGSARPEATPSAVMHRGPQQAPRCTCGANPPVTTGGTDNPFPFIRQRPLNRVSEWETTEGGGLKAVGVGAGVTGFGADLIIVDDPVKGREEAASEICREKLWNWFNDDLSTRLEPGGAIILIQTRWHEDDLAGRLLREQRPGGEQWTVVSLPALSEPPVVTGGPCSDTDPLGRTPGEALWPERFPAEHFEHLRESRGEFYFASLYQQRPVPAEGGVFKRAWFANIVDQAPRGLKWKRGYDLAVSTKRTADYTATFRVAFDAEGYLYIDGGCRRRIDFLSQKRLIAGYIRSESNTEHGIETALHGRAFMQELAADARLHGRRFRGVDARGDKLERAGTWLTAAAEGRIRLVRGHWNRDFIDEVCSFPHGKHDDQIDAVSIAMSLFDRRSSALFFISPNNPNGELRIAGSPRRYDARLP